MDGNKNQKVNIIIVNYNSWKDTVACISSIINSTYNNYQIFVVDNASPNDDVEHLYNWLKSNELNSLIIDVKETSVDKKVNLIDNSKIIIFKNDENLGYGAGNNLAIQYLINIRNHEYLWLLNPDTTVQKEVLSHLVQLAHEKENMIFGNVMYHYYDQNKMIRYGGFRVNKLYHGVSYITKQKEVESMDSVSGASLFTDIKTFQHLGLFPEHYFMYWEETDFCAHAKNNGYTFGVNNKSKVFDKGGTESNSNFSREYLYLLNGLRYYKKYYPMYLPVILLSTLGKWTKALLFGSRSKRKAMFYGQLDFVLTVLGQTINIRKRIFNNSHY